MGNCNSILQHWLIFISAIIEFSTCGYSVFYIYFFTMSVGVAHRSVEESNTALLGEIRRLVAQQDRHAKWLDELAAKVNQQGIFCLSLVTSVHS